MLNVTPTSRARVAFVALLACAAPLSALAQTSAGEMAAIDPTEKLSAAGIIMMFLVAGLILMLFQPWQWPEKFRKRRQRKDRARRRDN